MPINDRAAGTLVLFEILRSSGSICCSKPLSRFVISTQLLFKWLKTISTKNSISASEAYMRAFGLFSSLHRNAECFWMRPLDIYNWGMYDSLTTYWTFNRIHHSSFLSITLLLLLRIVIYDTQRAVVTKAGTAHTSRAFHHCISNCRLTYL